MKLPCISLAALLLIAHPRAGATDDGGFDPLPAERYEAMAQRSPFALATAVVAPQAPQASFAANWYVVGIGRLGESDFVTIKSRDAGLLFSLYGNETHPSTGVSLVSVSWSETVGKSTVVLRKGTEMAKLEFNEEDLRSSPTVAANPGGPNVPKNPGQPGQAGQMQPGQMQPGNPQMQGMGQPLGTISPPGVMQRNPVTVTPMQTGQPMAPGVGTPGEIRRRVRPIPMPNQPPP